MKKIIIPLSLILCAVSGIWTYFCNSCSVSLNALGDEVEVEHKCSLNEKGCRFRGIFSGVADSIY